MRNFLKLLIGLLIFHFPNAFALSCLDGSGHSVVLTKPAHRIISLAPNLTEILFAIGAGPFVKGISTANDYPETAKNLAIVANEKEINIETIYYLKPDLVVAWQGGNSETELAFIKKLGIPVYEAKFSTIADIFITMEHLALLTGKEQQAKKIIIPMQNKFMELQKKYSKAKKLKVFYQLWGHPLLSLNENSMINQIIDLCGGQNIFSKMHALTAEVSTEAVLVANPAVIFTSEENKNWYRDWQKWPQLLSVQDDNLFQLPPDLIERPGPRLIQGALLMCRDLQIARMKKP